MSLSSSRLGSGSSACRGLWLAAFFYPEVILAKKRVACFIDPSQHEIVVVYYFSHEGTTMCGYPRSQLV